MILLPSEINNEINTTYSYEVESKLSDTNLQQLFMNSDATKKKNKFITRYFTE